MSSHLLKVKSGPKSEINEAGCWASCVSILSPGGRIFRTPPAKLSKLFGTCNEEEVRVRFFLEMGCQTFQLHVASSQKRSLQTSDGPSWKGLLEPFRPKGIEAAFLNNSCHIVLLKSPLQSLRILQHFSNSISPSISSHRGCNQRAAGFEVTSLCSNYSVPILKERLFQDISRQIKRPI